jgi:trigger factor
MDQLLKRYSFQPPETMVEEALRDHLVLFSHNLRQQGINPEKLGINWQKIAEEAKPQAIENARSQVIVDIIAEKESINVSEEELNEEIGILAGRGGKTPDAFRANLQKENRLEQIRHQLVRRKTRLFLRQHAIVN